jgi:hypothetical protein
VKVTILIRSKLNDGTYPYLPAVVNANGKIKPGVALVDGVETQVKGSYYLRFTQGGKRHLVCAGDDATEARAAAEKKSRELKLSREAKALGQSSRPNGKRPKSVSKRMVTRTGDTLRNASTGTPSTAGSPNSGRSSG